MTSSLDPGQRSALLAAKLRALVGTTDGSVGAPFDALSFPAGTAARVGDVCWVLLDSSSAGLGAVLAWAGQQGLGPGAAVANDIAVHVIVDGTSAGRAATVARQATRFTGAPTVYEARGRELVPVVPAPFPSMVDPPPAALALVTELQLAGIDVVIEHGSVRGEIEGLEVAIVVVDGEGTARVEVGVGRNDREAFALLHGGLPPVDAMRKVAATVRQHRRAGAEAHPLNRMAGERWLRSQLLRDAERFPGWALEPIAGPTPRTGVGDRGPAYAEGRDDQGRPVVLACSLGIDLELVPLAADVRAAVDPDARLVLALPARDVHPVMQRLAAALVRPAEIVALEGEWRR